MITAKKSEASSTPISTYAGMNRVSELTKPVKVPSWKKDMSLEKYTKQLTKFQTMFRLHSSLANQL